MRSTYLAPATILAGWLILGLPGTHRAVVAAEPASILIVEGGELDLGETPLLVEVDPQAVAPGRYQLRDQASGSVLPGLAFRDQDKTFFGFVLDGVPARSTVKFALSPDRSPLDPSRGVSLVARGERISVDVDGKPWTTYIPDDGPKPYFDPLIGPSNITLTRNWPMRDVAGDPHDHPHHRSLWFGHMDVNKTDTWSELPTHGQVKETSKPTVVGGGPVGVLRTTDDWLDRSGGKVCEDERVVRFYATKTTRVFDYDVTLKASKGVVKVGDNKDGVFAIRVAPSMALTAEQGGRIVNSRGVVDRAAWGQAAEWVDYSGPVAGQRMGITIFNKPTSFRFPTTWHVRDYGLFAANPFGWHDFGQSGSGDHTIEAGGSIHLAYRVVLHGGDSDPTRIETQFQGYAKPPKVTVQ